MAKGSVKIGQGLKVVGGGIKTGAVKAGSGIKSLSNKNKEKKESGDESVSKSRFSIFRKKNKTTSQSVLEPSIEVDRKLEEGMLEPDLPSA